MTHSKAGKGDRYRPVNRERYEENYDRIFGEKVVLEESQEPTFFDTINELNKVIEEANRTFQKFPKIPRLYRDIIITEKIDGTNAQIYISEGDGPIMAGSRNHWLHTDQSDNYGFGAWVREHAEELRQLGPGRHFGEWWGRGINRGYGQNYRYFSLFNVGRWRSVTHDDLPFVGDEKRIDAPACCDVVPILYAGQFSEEMIGNILMTLKENGSKAAFGFMNPEGIVIYHTHGNCCFKITFENDDKPKGRTDGK